MKEIFHKDIINFIRFLSNKYDICYPQKQENDWVYLKFNPETEIISPKPRLTILPPKKFLLPHDEKIFENPARELNKITTSKPIILFGVNSFDIHALTILDQVMAGPHKNNAYFKNRNNITIIGVGPERINIASKGFDLFLEEHANSYLAIPGSVKGNKLTKLEFFKTSKIKPKSILSFKDPVFNQLEKIQNNIEGSYKGKIWEKIAKTCFGCGICAYVCPLCYCFETEDNYKSGNCDSCREKKWDACFLPDFFAVAGHNFRENLSDRIYNWYHHKFVRMPREYGHIGCVDCGRCIEYCPAKINFKEVLKELIK